MDLSMRHAAVDADPQKSVADEPPVALVVDDDEDVREECSDILTSRGIPNITAANADDALAKLLAHRSVHAVLVDIRMPGRNGFDLLQQIHLFCGNEYAVEAIVMSAYVGSLLEQHPARAFAAAYLTKPATSDEICNATLKAAAKAADRRTAAARPSLSSE